MNAQLNFAETINNKICHFIAKKIISPMTQEQKIALISPWCRSFTHTTLHYYLTASPGISNEFNPDNAPGDTLAFMRWHKTDEFLEYLSGNHSPNKSWVQIQTESELLVMPRFFWAKTICFQSGIRKRFLSQLIFFSFFKIQKLSYKKSIRKYSINAPLREEIFQDLADHLKEYPFGVWLSQKTLEMLPRIFLEGINAAYTSYNKTQSFDTIFSSDCWSSIDSLKIMAFAQKNKKKMTLIGTPHAFNYSALDQFWLTSYELTFLDKYLSWGNLHVSHKNFISFFINKFAGYKRSLQPKIVNDRNPILFTGAMRPNHLVEYPFDPAVFQKYLLQEIDIARVTAKITNQSVKIRTRNRDRGGSFELIFKNNSPPNVTLDFQTGTFINEVINYSLHISDNTSTTIIESLIINHPTIIIITNEYFSINSIAIASFDRLKEVGIFHTSIESYTAHLKKINGHINDWWQDHKTQLTIVNFLDEHARVSGSIIMWKKALLNL